MGSNMEWLRSNMVVGNYNYLGANTSLGLKLAGGVATLPPDSNGAVGTDVNFGAYFRTNTKVVVAATVISDSVFRVHLTIRGLGTLHPDYRGFRAAVRTAPVGNQSNELDKTIYVSWIALGQ